MKNYVAELADRIKNGSGTEGGSGPPGGSGLLIAEYVSPGVLRIGGVPFEASVNPDLLISCSVTGCTEGSCAPCGRTALSPGEKVLAARIGTDLYAVCRAGGAG